MWGFFAIIINPLFLLCLILLFKQNIKNNLFIGVTLLIYCSFVFLDLVRSNGALFYEITHAFRYTFFFSGFALVMVAHEIQDMGKAKYLILLFAFVWFMWDIYPNVWQLGYI